MLRTLLVTYEAMGRRLSYALTTIMFVFVFRVVIGLMRLPVRMGMLMNRIPMSVAVRMNNNLTAAPTCNAVLHVDFSRSSTHSTFL